MAVDQCYILKKGREFKGEQGVQGESCHFKQDRAASVAVYLWAAALILPMQTWERNILLYNGE